MLRYLPISISRIIVQEYADRVHNWLLANREGYTADLWQEPIENYSAAGQFTIKLPEEAEQIFTELELTVVIEGHLPSSWYAPAEPITY